MHNDHDRIALRNLRMNAEKGTLTPLSCDLNFYRSSPSVIEQLILPFCHFILPEEGERKSGERERERETSLHI